MKKQSMINLSKNIYTADIKKVILYMAP